MRVLHILNTNKFSGAENVVCQIINMFKDESDIEMAYCSLDGPIREVLQEKGITFLPISQMSVSELKRVVKNFHPDVIHAHDMRATLFASFACKKAKLISHIHNNHTEAQHLSIRSLSYLAAYPKIKHIFWVSEAALGGYFFNKVVSKKSSVLRNVIDAEEIYQKVEADKNDYDYDIVYLGRLSEEKDPLRLIEILKSVCSKTNAKTAFIGDGPLMEACRGKSKEYGIDAQVSFLGFRSNPYKILKCSKVLVMTSKFEGLPMCALEAQSLGIPIIGTPTDGLKELIVNDYNGYLSNDNNTIAEEIIHTMEDSAYSNRLSRNSSTVFCEKNNSIKYKQILIDEYNKQ